MWDIGPHKYIDALTQHIAIQTLVNGPKTYTHTFVYAQKHTLIQNTLTASASPSAVWVQNVSCSKEKNHCVTFGKKIILSVSLGGKTTNCFCR